MNDLLFVYGTLLPGRTPARLRHVAAQLRSVSSGLMPGRLYDLGDYPGAVFDAAASTRVLGEVFEVPVGGQILSQLDDYEGFSPANAPQSFFIRERQPIALTRGDQVQCWVYLYNRDPGNSPLIPDGDYSAWTTSRHVNHS